ncbi:protein rae1 [Quercus suber]|uniref:Protein rae1 n=1 Tax=Quercus suber TaxID=58331 RepID=A0AAW0IUF2_QUESU
MQPLADDARQRGRLMGFEDFLGYWDTRQSNPVSNQQLPDHSYSFTVRHLLMVVCPAVRNLIVFNLLSPQVWDATSADPKLLGSCCDIMETGLVGVWQWAPLNDFFVHGKRGIEKQPFQLPESVDTLDSRSRCANTTNRGGRGGADRYVGREPGGLYVKPAYKNENRTHAYAVSSS